MRPTSTTLCAVVLTLANVTPRAAQAYCRTTTQRAPAGGCSDSGIPLAWPVSCVGFSVYLAGSPVLPFDTVRTEAVVAAQRWRQITCEANATRAPGLQLLPLPETAARTGYDRTGPNANTVSFNTVWASDAAHRPGAIAITIVTFDTTSGAILDADMELNQQSEENPGGFEFSTGITLPGAADLPTILTHEFGHFQGIGHSDVETAVMWPEAGVGEQRRSLRSDDVDAICEAYPPESGEDRVCNPTPNGGFALVRGGSVVNGGCSVRPRECVWVPGRAHGTKALAVGALAWALAFTVRRPWRPKRGVHTSR